MGVAPFRLENAELIPPRTLQVNATRTSRPSERTYDPFDESATIDIP